MGEWNSLSDLFMAVAEVGAAAAVLSRWSVSAFHRHRRSRSIVDGCGFAVHACCLMTSR